MKFSYHQTCVVATRIGLLHVQLLLHFCKNTNLNRFHLFQVCLQFPDSLILDSVRVALYFEQCLDKKVYILGDTTCGSCCVDEIAANHINADGIIHFGHACLNPTSRLEVFHVLDKQSIDVDLLVQTVSEFFVDATRKILLFYDVAYAHAIGEFFSNFFELLPIFFIFIHNNKILIFFF